MNLEGKSIEELKRMLDEAEDKVGVIQEKIDELEPPKKVESSGGTPSVETEF